MRIRKRIMQLEKLLLTTKRDIKAQSLEQELVCEWLAENNEEFVEYVRKIFRLKFNVIESEDILDKQETNEEEVALYMERINELIEQHKDQALISVQLNTFNGHR